MRGVIDRISVAPSYEKECTSNLASGNRHSLRSWGAAEKGCSGSRFFGA